MRYADKVVIVTGGSKGIGEGCVCVFAAAGSTGVLCSRGEKAGPELEKAVQQEASGGGAVPDLRRPQGGPCHRRNR